MAVLISGGGPVGTYLAYLLGSRGHEVTLVEKRAKQFQFPRSHHQSPRTLEQFRQTGISVPILRSIAPPHAQTFAAHWTTALNGERLGSLPYEGPEEQYYDVTPEVRLCLSQAHLRDYILNEHVSKMKNVQILRSTEVIDVQQPNADTCISTLKDRISDKTFQVESRFVIGADGGSSQVRRTIGISVGGEAAFAHMLTVVFKADILKLLKADENPYNMASLFMIMSPFAHGVLSSGDPTGELAWGHPYDPSVEPFESFTKERCEVYIREVLADENTPFEIVNILPWDLQFFIAQQYRKGNVFLAGDAAHSHPPTGGLGLNSGFGDAHALAWRLHLVLNGNVDESILDAYERERQPVARHNAIQSVANGKDAVDLLRFMETPGLTDPVQCRLEADRKVKDPISKAQIDAKIAAQHALSFFNTIPFSLSYSYRTHAKPIEGEYIAHFEPGWRLPHEWIRAPEGSLIHALKIAPVDFSLTYPDMKGQADRQYSTLDLVPYDAYVLITPKGGYPASASDLTDLPLVFAQEGKDFELVDPSSVWSSSFGLDEDNVVLVRPDQHIAGIVKRTDKQALVDLLNLCKVGHEFE